jgi:hypothetical protein
MTRRDMFEQYLATVRRVRPWIGPGTEEELAGELAKMFGTELTVVVAYTSEQESRYHQLGGESFVVCDMNETRMLHWMNCVSLASKPQERFGILGSLVLASMLRNRGLLQEAFVYLQRFSQADRRVLEGILKTHSAYSETRYLAPQRIFSLAHEVAHSMVTHSNPSVARQYASASNDAILHAKEILETNAAELQRQGRIAAAAEVRSWISRIARSERLREEIVVDFIGRMFTFYMHSSKNGPLEDTAEAIVLVHCHLVALDRIKHYVKLFRTGRQICADDASDLDNRIRFTIAAGNAVSAVFAYRNLEKSGWGLTTDSRSRLRGSDSKRANKLNARLENLWHRHTATFLSFTDEWMIPSLQSLLDAHGGVPLTLKRPIPGGEVLQWNNAIDRLLGWEDAPVDSSSFLGKWS